MEGRVRSVVGVVGGLLLGMAGMVGGVYWCGRGGGGGEADTYIDSGGRAQTGVGQLMGVIS